MYAVWYYYSISMIPRPRPDGQIATLYACFCYMHPRPRKRGRSTNRNATEYRASRQRPSHGPSGGGDPRPFPTTPKNPLPHHPRPTRHHPLRFLPQSQPQRPLPVGVRFGAMFGASPILPALSSLLNGFDGSCVARARERPLGTLVEHLMREALSGHQMTQKPPRVIRGAC
jgi:hypothetical protein